MSLEEKIITGRICESAGGDQLKKYSDYSILFYEEEGYFSLRFISLLRNTACPETTECSFDHTILGRL